MAGSYTDYLKTLRTGFQKLAKLEFLTPSGTVEYMLDNNPRNAKSRAFLQSGSLSCALRNGRRREMDVTMANLDDAFSFAVGKIWFGQRIRYSEGLLLPDGTEYYMPQGVFTVENPSTVKNTNTDTVTYHLVDKWANIDGTLHGRLDGDYKIYAGTSIFAAISSLLRLGIYDMASDSDHPFDSVAPVYTTFYDGKTQTLTDGTVVSLTDTPYDVLTEAGKSVGDMILSLAEILSAWVGYDPAGRLSLSPSQDDLLDTSKPVVWQFLPSDRQHFSITKAPKATEVYNDVIVVGATMDNNYTPRGRAQNVNPASSTCIRRIGLKTEWIEMPNYYSNDVCEDYAAWILKRHAALHEAVTIQCQQLFHIRENDVVSIVDEKGKEERYVVQGFTRPVAETGSMSITAVSVNDLEVATLAS